MQSPSQPLPFRLLSPLELLQYTHLLLQRLQPLPSLLLHLLLVVSKFCKEILSVWGSGQCGAEDRLHHEGVVGFESVTVCVLEGDGEFVRGVLEIVLDGLRRKVETAMV